MALRVLLADESSTIKKVFQLALQNYAVEVKTVNVGLDVTMTAQKYQPDIIFADVILQKMNGYDVCAQLKSQPETRNIPVVIMWSGFMEVDSHKLAQCGADDQLEKPFDPDHLRDMIQKLVPKTQSNDLAHFLHFPKIPTETSDNPPSVRSGAATTSQPPPPPHDIETVTGAHLHSEDFPPQPEQDSSVWDMNSFEPIDRFRQIDHEEPQDEFRQVDLTEKSIGPSIEEVELDPGWVQEDLSKFSVDPKTLTQEIPAVEFRSAPAGDELQVEDVGDVSEGEFINNPLDPPYTGFERRKTQPVTADQIESYIRQQCQTTIEEIVWKVVPEMAKQIIENEIKRLLQERSQF